MTRSFVVVGDESLTLECLKRLAAGSHTISAVLTRSANIRDWAESSRFVVRTGFAEGIPDCDYLLSIANLRMIPKQLLEVPRIAAINFHDGPLPASAGVNAPVWALLNGETTHGVSWHRMTEVPDAGDLLEQATFEIDASDTAVSLNTRCFMAGLETFESLLRKIESDALEGSPQDSSRRTYFGAWQRPVGHGRIDIMAPWTEVDRLVRSLQFGSYENPMCSPKLVGHRGVILVSSASITPAGGHSAGTIVSAGSDSVTIECADGLVTFSGLLSHDGLLLAGSDAVSVLGVPIGEKLPLYNEVPAWFSEAVAKDERRHVRALASAVPVELPVVRPASSGVPGQATFEDVIGPEIESAPAIITAAFASFISRIAGVETTIHLNSGSQADESSVCDGLLFDPFIPVAAGLDLGRFETQRRAESWLALAPISRDIRARFPSLPKSLTGDLVALQFGEWAHRAEYHLLVSVHGTRTQWTYRRDRFLSEDIRQLADAFMEYVQEWVDQPEKDPSQLSVVSNRQRQLIAQWNDTALEYDKGATIVSQFEEQASMAADRPAVVAGAESMSYSDLDARANRLAWRLIELGAGPGNLVAVHMERSLNLVVALLGILKSGAAYVPVDPSYPEQRKLLMIEDSGAAIILSDSAILLTPSECTILQMGDEDSDGTAVAPKLRANPEDLAYVIYTSGSTGRPKGVMLEHRNVVNFFAGMDERLGKDPGTWLAVTSISFDISVLELLWTLTRGFAVVLHGARVARSDDKLGLSLYFFGDHPESAANGYDLMFEAAAFADSAGFEAIWTPERHFHAFGGAFPNPSVTAAALAASTKNIAIRAGSCVLPLHSPIRVAEEWAMVDQISRGRVGVSFAGGWQPNDFVLNPEAYGLGKSALEREIAVVQSLWRGESQTFPGVAGDAVEVRTLPRPVQAELPTWLTSAGDPETFRMAGRLGFNLLTHLLGQSLDDVRRKVAIYREARAAAGHQGPGHVTLMLHAYVAETDESARRDVRQPMMNYLRSSVGLIAKYASNFPIFKNLDAEGASGLLAGLSESDMDDLLEVAFERYYITSGLFGDKHRASEILDHASDVGVNEVACLVDFGVGHQEAMASLRRISELIGEKAAEEPEPIPGLIRGHRVTHLQCTPSMAGMLASDPDFRRAAENLNTMLVGGEAFPTDLANDLRELVGGALINMYGPTETTIWSTTASVDSSGGPVSIGTPIANTSVYILDKEQRFVPPGVVGEIWIGGDGVARGYLGRDDLTRDRFVVDPFAATCGARMYRTGDLGRFAPDGSISFLGRVDQQVKVRGHRIEPGEIETVVRSANGIADAVVVAREDEPGDLRLVCYFVPTREDAADPLELRDTIAAHLPAYMVPTNFVALAALPLTPNKKVDRNALPPPGTAAFEPGIPRTPEMPAESSRVALSATLAYVAENWRTVLKTSDLPHNRTFFDCGGNSLLLVQLHKRLVLTHSGLRLTDLFKYPTINALASHLDDNEPSTPIADDASSRALARRAAAGRRPVHA